MTNYPARQPRKVLEGTATVEIAGQTLNMELADLSLGGVTLCSPTAIPHAAEACVLTFSIPSKDGAHEIKVNATMTHCRYSFVYMRCRSGFQFQQLDELATKFITGFMEESPSPLPDLPLLRAS